MLTLRGPAVFRSVRLAGVCAACVLLPFAAAGQVVGDTSGAIDGIVTDRTGGALPGVAVRATSAALMGVRTGVSGNDGTYRLPGLPPGDYALTFELPDFQTTSRDGVRVTFGGTTTVLVTLDVTTLREQVTVDGGVRVLDRAATMIAARMDGHTLENLPGSRSMAAILAATPAVQLTRFDVGGSTTFAMGVFSAYGFGGFNRPTLEGVVISGLNPYGFSLDYGSFDEVSVGLGAYGPELPSPGVHVQVITKSGGNQYHGGLYAAYADARWQSRNIDDDQIARGALGPAGFRPDEANRQESYHDANADVGGFVSRDRLWWYASGRDQRVAARRVTFPVKPIETRSRNVSAKATFRANDRSSFVLFGQRGTTRQPIRLEAFLRGEAAVNESLESTTDQLSGGRVWKAEWNGVAAGNLFVDARIGQFAVKRADRPNGGAPRIEDINEPFVHGGNRDWRQALQRDQLYGSLSYFTDGRYGQHHVKAGGEVHRFVETETWKRSYPGDVLHVLRSGVPAEVYLFQTPSESSSGQWWYAVFLNDAWRPHARLTLNLGLRFDRFRVFLPEQHHPKSRFNPTDQSFPAVRNVIDWNVAAPRIGASVNLDRGGRTILKASGGRYWLTPDTELGFNVNPNGRSWWSRYAWSDDNGNLLWERGEESAVALETRGGESLDVLDPGLKLTYVHELSARVEREIGGRLRVNTGTVWRGIRQQGIRQQASWSFDAFTVASTLRDPGPAGGTLGTAGDGPGIRVYDLPGGIAPSEFVVRNVDRSNSDYLTWEAGADRRFDRGWSLAGSFAHTWHRSQASSYFGQTVRANVLPLTPNDLVQTDEGGRHVFGIWSAKAHATFEAPWALRITPLLRHQSGQPFGRTVAARLNYGTIRLLAEPMGTRRQDHVTLVDLGIQKQIAIAGRRLVWILDVFNLLNGNPEQNVNWASGPSFLRPLAIVPPRLARVGVKIDW